MELDFAYGADFADTYTERGHFILAGIPWFATLFGRDSIITALSLLPFNPSLARGTLRILASLQGSEINDARDEQPGKIVHEIRHGEMARTGEASLLLHEERGGLQFIQYIYDSGH